MKNVKRIIIITLGTLMVLLFIRKAYLLLFRRDLPHILRLVNGTDFSSNKNIQPKWREAWKNGFYNYDRMLSLVKRATQIKTIYYERFRKNKNVWKSSIRLDSKEVRGALEDLFREKIRLRKYMREESVQFNGKMPIKRRRALLFYQRTVEKCIKDLKQILRQL